MPEVACRHGRIKIKDDSGEYRTVSMCDIGPDDINDDGTVSFPLTGECQGPDRDRFVELATSEDIAEAEAEYVRISERNRLLNQIIRNAKALRRDYESADLPTNERLVRDIERRAEQLRGEPDVG